MITMSIRLRGSELEDRGACEEGWELFDELAPAEPGPDGEREIVLPPPGHEWTARHWLLADLLLRTHCEHYAWLVGQGLWLPRPLTGADLRGAYLRDAYLTGADLRDAYLRDADLTGADLRDADLRDAYLTGADLRDADLRGAYLRDADLTGADLTGADLRDADLRDAYLRDADLHGAYLTGWERGPDGFARRNGAP